MMNILFENTGTIGLLMFLIFFIVILFMLYTPGAKEKYEAFGKIPFEGEKHD